MPRRRSTPAAFAQRHGRPQDPYDEGYNDGYAEGVGDGYHQGLLDAKRGLFAPPGTRRRQPGGPRVAAHKKRKTAYQSAYSAAYKRLKKKHPRMSFGSLSKKAHAAARKKVK